MGTTVVVGASRGIGLAICKRLAARGETVIGVCRKAPPELAAIGVEVVEGVDVTSERSVAELARRLADRQIDVVHVVAGILEHTRLDALDFERIRAQLEVNALGPLRVSGALVPSLHPGSKIALYTSRMGSLGDNTSGSHYGYRMSKAALNMAGVSLAHDLRGRGIAVVLLHPGFVRTEMTGGNGDVSADESAAGCIARVDELTLETSGRFLHANGTTLPW